MADYIPFEIHEEIIRRITDAKSLIRFRSVSKPWKSLIDSSKFIADFQVTHTRPHDVLLVRCYDPVQDYKVKYVSVLDDDSCPKHKSSVPVPEFVKLSDRIQFVGSSQGLFCFYDFRMKTAVLWNPTIRKSVDIVVPNVLADSPSFDIVVAFGACPRTRDPMLVKINYICEEPGIHDVSCIPWQVEVYTLSSRTWRSPSCNLPRKSISWWRQSQIVIDGFIYWAVSDWFCDDNTRCQIMSFDMANEEFADIYLPGCLTSSFYVGIDIFEFKGALAVLEIDFRDEQGRCGVWLKAGANLYVGMWGHLTPLDVENLFRKLFIIRSPVGASIYHVLGFRKSGNEAIIETRTESGKFDLSLYQPFAEQMNDIGISGNELSCFTISYMETLLLLDS